MPITPWRLALAFVATLTAAQLFPAPIALPFGKRLQKAFAALEMHDYFLARKLFRQEAKRHPAAAWYGLSVISGRANNPFHDE
ncbi:MAG TPA: hypothetical protein PKY96_07670, partial [Flavobacteriales bacterium]|nr:hypothetical protein [Flavobacteriales bacterium]